MNYLIVPGFGGSSSEHWQSRWEGSNANFSRLEQANWECAVNEEWISNLERAVARLGPNTVLIAHSLACLLIANWAAQTKLPILGSFLVAVPDPLSEYFPADAFGFENFAKTQLQFPSLVIASSNDPYASLEFSKTTARTWGSCWKNIGAYGHINAESGLGDWPAGLALLMQAINKTRVAEYAV